MILKKDWSEIDVEMFMELKTINEEYNTYFSNKLETLAILSDTLYDDNIWGDMDCDEIEKLYDSISFINKSPSRSIKDGIKDFKYKGVRNITLGEYIDLNKWFSDGYYNNLDKILSVLYRRFRLDEFNRIVLEDYTFNINERRYEFHDVSINDCYGVIEEFIKFKTEIEDSYTFFQNIPDEEEEDDIELSYEEKLELKKEIEEEKKQMNWVWESMVYNLADEDITKMKDVLNLKVIFVFNMISYKQSLR